MPRTNFHSKKCPTFHCMHSAHSTKILGNTHARVKSQIFSFVFRRGNRSVSHLRCPRWPAPRRPLLHHSSAGARYLPILPPPPHPAQALTGDIRGYSALARKWRGVAEIGAGELYLLFFGLTDFALIVFFCLFPFLPLSNIAGGGDGR